jgi:hypothetical protein
MQMLRYEHLCIANYTRELKTYCRAANAGNISGNLYKEVQICLLGCTSV